MSSAACPEVRARHEWFLRSLLLYRLMQKASTNPSINGTVVEIWATLASSGQYLKALLEHNIIWSEEEKDWFADLKDENDGVRYVVNLMVPKHYRADPIFQEIANCIWEDARLSPPSANHLIC
jgi:hypothetical protein